MRMYCDRHLKLLPKGKCPECQMRNLGYVITLVFFVLVPGVIVLAMWLAGS